jgi:hypothetical protein
MSGYPSDLFSTATLDADAMRIGEAMAKNIASMGVRPGAYLPPPYAAPALTEADVRRIVREEMETARPVPSVLDVTPEDVRRWLR